jgi:hypothetical protein
MIGLLSAKSSARSSFVSRALQTLAQARRQTEDGGAALLPRYAAETPFPEAWGGFRCSACGQGMLTDVRPHWAARQAAGQITPP